MNTLLTTCLAKASFLLAVSTVALPAQMPNMNSINVQERQVGSSTLEMDYVEKNYEEYLGKYKLDTGEDNFFTLTYKNGHLMGELTGAGTIEIFPEEKNKDTFFAKAAPAQFTFARNKKGKIDTLLIAITGKGEMKGKKVE
jgi:hypothetical protein